MKTWQVLITPPAHSGWNMAADESILEKARCANLHIDESTFFVTGLAARQTGFESDRPKSPMMECGTPFVKYNLTPK